MAGKGKLKGLHLPLRAYIMYLLLICFALTGVTFSIYVTSTYGDASYFRNPRGIAAVG